METTQLTGFIGDSTSFQIPLTWAGTAFAPGETWTLIFTAKYRSTDVDADAVFQKASGAGITLSGPSTAVVATVPADTVAMESCVLHCDIQAQHLTTGEVRTVAYARLSLSRDVTRETTVSLPIYTTEEYVARGPNGADREVKSASFTAANGTSYAVTASATVTDPTPVEGKGYSVLVVNGTATIGGTAYATAGTVIERVYHSSTWRSTQYKDSAAYAAASHTHTAAEITDPENLLTPIGAASLTGANITDPDTFKENLEIPEHQIAVATSDTTGILGVTPSDDAELVLQVEANATYLIRANIAGTSVGDFSVGGMRIALGGPTCSSIFLRYQKICYGTATSAVAAQTAGTFANALATEATQHSGVATVTSTYTSQLEGIFTVGTTGGALKIKVAQHANGGAGLTRKAGSTLELIKL